MLRILKKLGTWVTSPAYHTDRQSVFFILFGSAIAITSSWIVMRILFAVCTAILLADFIEKKFWRDPGPVQPYDWERDGL